MTAKPSSAFVPDGFMPLERLDHPSFRLRPLGPEHNRRDHAAWTGSMDHIRVTPGFAERSWPYPMSLAANLGDLERHARDFVERVGFTFTVLEPGAPVDTADVIGCVYIYPDKQVGTDVHVLSWVTAEHAHLDAELATTVRSWLEAEWPWSADQIRDHPRPAST